MKKLSVIFLIFFFSLNLKIYSQEPTIGLRYIGDSPTEGYILFSPEQNNTVYLIDNCGKKINEWTFSELPGASCYLLENGNLLRAGKDSLEIRDWNNNLIWSYPTTINGIRQHHDIEPLPNGNIICIVSDAYTQAVMTEEGRDPTLTADNFRLEKIVELQPVGSDDAVIVWEWKFFDHLIQDFDETKNNYGIVEDHPELLDINFNNGKDVDWVHLNAIDYNATLDQIIISSRHLSEIFIIDHTTTTIEAASHTGGNSNLGGDFLWRWGNPQVYRQGSNADQKLLFQHDSKWVETGYLDEGKITVFDNNIIKKSTNSLVHIITPVIENGTYLKENNMFLPLDYEWSWQGSLLGDDMFELNKSGVQSLPNGNILICETSKGQISEITKSGDHLWTYKNPSGGSLFNQFDIILANENRIFRAQKYPIDFPGFVGKDMTPNGIIEDVNSLSADCGNVLVENINQYNLKVQNPVTDKRIKLNRNVDNLEISVYNLNGELVFMKNNFSGSMINTNLQSGFYIVKFSGKNIQEYHKIVINN